MAKKKGIINNADKIDALSSAENALQKAKNIEAKNSKKLKKVKITNGYVLTTNVEKWKQL